ncbi:diaminopimelate epimerase [Rubrivirga sp. S365]|uniref:Diaminopimelate epimerase n=1 Tax=Rubrivirga litoralis TaxID=3075598 RepID=A0ABU3BUR4_9BACT|nr:MULTISPECIES: diaminopimelate epimerase [unclassified Rubrivirga]MDT0633025.1 diaminopimelate epimerase [Rubrivirga sp. F394]MDT7856775.1 diaminopimelate epimerase [Rubrivirga sp. S365]
MSTPPRPALVVPFTKMDGAGNDFVVVDNRFLRFSEDELAALARRVCPRRGGVGADGLLALEEPDAEGAHFRMRYRNADGSLATMCGNGARCLARFAARAGLGEPAGDEGGAAAEDEGGAVALVFDTDGGRVRAVVPAPRLASGEVTITLPPPRDFGPTGLRDGPTPKSSRVYRVWTGTEHAVVFVGDLDREDVAATGGRLRWDHAFRPAGTNVDFVQVTGADRLAARTFEKGVEGETLACGTGALAAAVVAALTDQLDRPAPDGTGGAGRYRVAVDMPGGTLTVAFRLDGGEVSDLTLSGPADTAYEGTLEWRGGAVSDGPGGAV